MRVFAATLVFLAFASTFCSAQSATAHWYVTVGRGQSAEAGLLMTLYTAVDEAPAVKLLDSHPILPASHISHLVNGPIGGLGHPSATQGVILLAVVVVTLIVIIKLAIPS